MAKKGSTNQRIRKNREDVPFKMIADLGNDGILVDNPDWDIKLIPGKIGGAVEFYGEHEGSDGDYFDCGSDPCLNNLSGPISIALWIRPDADDPEGKGSPDGETAPMAKAMSGMSPDWSWQVRYGWFGPEPYMSFTFNTTPRAWAFVGRNLERYEWCHISCSYDGTTLKCYLDGVETDSTPMGPITSSEAPVLIGSDGWGCDWIGAIDDVMIYDRPLSEAEITLPHTPPISGSANGLMISGTVLSVK